MRELLLKLSELSSVGIFRARPGTQETLLSTTCVLDGVIMMIITTFSYN